MDKKEALKKIKEDDFFLDDADKKLKAAELAKKTPEKKKK